MNSEIENAIINTVDSLSPESKADYVGMKVAVRKSLEYLEIAMFPEFTGKEMSTCIGCENNACCSRTELRERRISAFSKASVQLSNALRCVMSTREAESATAELIRRIPDVRRVLDTDIEAAYEGDPAARSTDEIILAYPAFKAISIFRIAHELYLMKVPTVPRMMTEYAHEITGIDINPGATVGTHFFIDHGTGVVIGETTTIGEHVKIYQNVTLGAKSFAAAEDGTLVKGIKRHPDIGNNVVIYAGATILGGNTRIGDNAVIGGNVWVTHSVPAGRVVTQGVVSSRRPAESEGEV